MLNFSGFSALTYAAAVALAAITFDHLGTPEQMAALRDVVERHGVTATFFVTGERAAEDPAGVRALQDAGHEVGMHGWAHEAWSELPPDEERALATRATECHRRRDRADRRAASALRAARESEATADILGDLGYTYDASLGDRMNPVRLSPAVAQVPFVWPGVDGYWYLRDEPEEPTTVSDAWLKSLAKAELCSSRSAIRRSPASTSTGSPPSTAVVAAAQADDRIELATVGAIAARIPA